MAVNLRQTIEVSLPLRTRSTLNTREHWAKRAKRAQEERAVVRMRLAVVRGWPPPLPVTVTLTRVGPRKLDGDNVQGALKAARDAVADALGVDDGSEEVQWLYEQEKGAYEVRVKVEAREPGAFSRGAVVSVNKGSEDMKRPELPKEVEDMIARRRKNTGETWDEALAAIVEFHQQIEAGKRICDVVDDDGVHIGVRDAAGYHPNASDPARRGKA